MYRAADSRDDDAARRLNCMPVPIKSALDTPFEVTPAMIAEYQANGHIHISGVLPPEIVDVLGSAIRENTMALNPQKGRPLAEREGGDDATWRRAELLPHAAGDQGGGLHGHPIVAAPAQRAQLRLRAECWYDVDTSFCSRLLSC